MNNNKMISKELCDFIESTKGNPNNLISFLRKAGHLANFSLNEVLFMKKENMRESPYKDMSKAEKAELLKKIFKNNESLEVNVHGKDRKISLGNYRGFDFKIAKDEISGRYKFFLKNKLTYSSNFAKSKNIFSQLDDFIDNEIKNLETRTSEELLYAKRKYQDILEHKDDKFPDADELIKLKLRKEKLDEAKEEILKELELRDKILEEKFIKNGMLTERGDFMDFNKKIEFSM